MEQPLCEMVTLPLPLTGFVNVSVSVVATIFTVYEPDSDAFQFPLRFVHCEFAAAVTVRLACTDVLP